VTRPFDFDSVVPPHPSPGLLGDTLSLRERAENLIAASLSPHQGERVSVS